MNRKAKATVAGMTLLLCLALGATLASALAPSVTSDNASDVAYTTARATGEVDPQGLETTCHFEYVTDAQFNEAENGGFAWASWADCEAQPGSGSGPQPVAAQLGGLAPGTTYHLRLVADNADGQSEDVAEETFTTKSVAKPIITEPTATGVGYTIATLSAEVTPGGEDEAFNTYCHFEYVSDAKFQQAENGGFAEAAWAGCDVEPVTGGGATEVKADLAPGTLAPGTTYHLRLVAENLSGANRSETEAPYPTFETKAGAAPSVTAPVVSDVTGGSAHLQGEVGSSAPADNAALSDDAKAAFDTSWHFELSTDNGANWFEGQGGSTEADDEAETVDRDQALEPSKTYLVRLVAANASGRVESAPVEVTTGTIPPDQVTDSPTLDPTQTTATVVQDANLHNAPLTDCRFVYGIGSAAGNQVPCAGTDEVQIFRYSAKGGQFRLSFRGETTEDLPFDASRETVQAALEALPSIGPSNVVVSRRFSEAIKYEFTARFVGALGEQDVEQLEAEDGSEPLENGIVSSELGVLTGSQGASGPVVSQDNQSQSFTGRLSGLSPGSEYYFKLVIVTAGGTVEGKEQYFLTASPAPAGACPNEAIRERQDARAPECRAYEMVTPPDKNGGEVSTYSLTALPAHDGNGLAFAARASFGDTVGSSAAGQTQYVAKRGAGGWASHGINVTPRPDITPSFGVSYAFNFSEDLSRAVLSAFDLPGVTGDNSFINYYSMDTATRALQPVTTPLAGPVPPFMLREFTTVKVAGASSDSRLLAFSAASHLLPEAPVGEEVKNAYEWEDGTLRLAGILPDGKIPPEGSRLASEDVLDFATAAEGYRQTVAPDGSAVFFKSPPYASSGQLYARVDHSRTVWISEPETTGPSPEPEEVILQQVTGDSHHVIFTTTSQLLDEDDNDGPDLYLYTDGPDPADESNLTLVSDGPTKGQVTGRYKSTKEVFTTAVTGSSDDGRRIYYRTSGAGGRFWLWEEGVTKRLMNAEPDGGGTFVFGAIFTNPGGARVSPDGRYLAYWEPDPVGRSKVYLYDAEGDSLTCVSCFSHGDDGNGAVLPVVSAAEGTVVQIKGLRPSFLSDDGQVFFSTPEALVPEDTNGAMDAYGYDPATAEASLYSTGDGAPARFANASPSGDDVFFITRHPILAGDPDVLVDIYDARVGGGFPEPPEPRAPCIGEGCKGSSPASPGNPAITSTLAGPGNKPPKPGGRCRHGRKKAGHGRKARCAKHDKKKPPRNRAASTNRRAGR